jgi:hypothetical protein
MLSSLRFQTDFTRLSVRLMKARLRVPITSDTTTPRDDSRKCPLGRARHVNVTLQEQRRSLFFLRRCGAGGPT